MNETVEPQQVPCTVCGKPAPRYGRYAGRCEDHRAEQPNNHPRRKNDHSEELVMQGDLDEARDILRRLVMDGDTNLDDLRLEAARHLIGTAL